MDCHLEVADFGGWCLVWFGDLWLCGLRCVILVVCVSFVFCCVVLVCGVLCYVMVLCSGF